MTVTLEPYNPQWPLRFAQEKAFLLQKIGSFLEGSVEHVGSTSVEGLLAKPVIDIMFGVHSLASSEEAIHILQANGYCYYPYKSDVMHWFCKPSPEVRTHHLHLIPFNSPLWKERIRFRDILRQNAPIAEAYGELKQSLAAQMADDREAYTQNKWPFIQRILADHQP